VHRDIKPENILFFDKVSLKIKLIDFGCAQKVDPNVMMTVPFGSPLYMAPEVIKGHYNLKCDIWSIGIVLHIMLVNSAPFHSHIPKEVMRQIESAT
jgi:calcium-dependent protein kinase